MLARIFPRTTKSANIFVTAATKRTSNQLAASSTTSFPTFNSHFSFHRLQQQQQPQKMMNSSNSLFVSSNNQSNNNDSTFDKELLMQRPVEASMQRKLTEALNPIHLQIINESHKHKVPKNSETHFKVFIVSEQFTTVKNLIERHRMVNEILKDEIASDGPVHALSIVAKTPTQWECMQIKSPDGIVTIEPSPPCKGGDGSLPRSNII